MSSKKIRVLVVEVDGTTRIEHIKPDLAAFKALLNDGWLEGIGGPGWAGYVDEEGKIKGLEINRVGTLSARALGWGSDLLCGPVIFVGPANGNGDDTSVPEEVVSIVETVKVSW